MVVADWGSAWVTEDGGTHMGGTPVYAGPNTYNQYNKDLFSFGRLAMELMMDKSGTESKYKTYFCFQQVSNLSLSLDRTYFLSY